MRPPVLIAAKRRLDPDAEQAYADGKISTLRGARQVSEVNRVLKRHGVYDTTLFIPMTDSTGAGSGATAYNLGGIGGDMTLVNGPTWGTDGVQFVSTSSQYGTIPDFIGSQTLTVFLKISTTNLTPIGTESFIGQYSFTSDQRSWLLQQTVNGEYRLARSSDGSSLTVEIYATNDSQTSLSMRLFNLQWVNPGGRSLEIDGADVDLVLDAGVPNTTRLDASIPVAIAARGSAAEGFTEHANMTASAVCITLGDISDDARASISNVLGRL